MPLKLRKYVKHGITTYTLKEKVDGKETLPAHYKYKGAPTLTRKNNSFKSK